MKIKILILFFLGFLSHAYAQDGLSRHLENIQGCYLDYYSAFANKGAKLITDGEHEVVISIIYQGSSECYMGKTTIKGGKLVVPVLIQKEDMSYAPLSTIFKNIDQEWLGIQDKNTLYDINDGMSKVFVSQQGYRVQMFFPKLINSNSAANRKAPPASELLKGGN